MAIVFSPRVLGMWCCVVAILVPSMGHSSVVTFGDSKAVWDGWGPPPGNVPVTQDEHGIPIIPGTPGNPGDSAGSATFANGYLTQITVNYWVPEDKRGTAYNNIWKDQLLPGDLFLGLGGTDSFSYVVRPGTTTGVPGIGENETWRTWQLGDTWTAWKLSNDIAYTGDPNHTATTHPDYVLGHHRTRGADQGWQNAITREYHPWAATTTALNGAVNHGNVTFSGWYTGNLNSFGDEYRALTWNFGNGIFVGSDASVTIGFTLNCANDVLLETITSPILPSQPADTDPIPEPHAFAIWSLMALLGGWWAHRRLRPAKKAKRRRGTGGLE